MLRKLWTLCSVLLAVMLVAFSLGCGKKAEKEAEEMTAKAEDITAKAAEINEKMQKEITANPMKAEEIRAKYQKELDELTKKSKELAE